MPRDATIELERYLILLEISRVRHASVDAHGQWHSTPTTRACFIALTSPLIYTYTLADTPGIWVFPL